MRNFKLFIPVIFLTGMGLVMLSSISERLFLAQSVWVLLGLGVVFLLYYFDWKRFLDYPWIIWSIYGITVLLLAVVLKAPALRAKQSWLSFGLFNFQPVELAKICLILVYARFFSRLHISIARWSVILQSFVYFAIPGILDALQPDLGSALILAAIWAGFLLVSGLPLRRMAVLALIGILAAIFMWNFVLKNYHKERIMNVFYPERNVQTFNWNVAQSKIAIGHAGWWGEGYHQGSELQGGFLPEAASDFMLAGLIEEWGWIAGAIAVIAICSLVFMILRIGILSDRNFEKFMCLGAALVIMFQFLLNAGSVIGLTPVVGVPFPFLSYGGSNLMINFLMIGFIVGIRT